MVKNIKGRVETNLKKWAPWWEIEKKMKKKKKTWLRAIPLALGTCWYVSLTDHSTPNKERE